VQRRPGESSTLRSPAAASGPPGTGLSPRRRRPPAGAGRLCVDTHV